MMIQPQLAAYVCVGKQRPFRETVAALPQWKVGGRADLLVDKICQIALGVEKVEERSFWQGM